jgi:hypothetical protein
LDRNRLNTKEIIRLLKENDGEMKVEEICDILGIVPYDIPWGHNIGWAKCLQPNQKYHLILSGENSDADDFTHAHP